MSTMILNDERILQEGMTALHKRLGPARAARFLGLQPREPQDYVEVSRKCYKTETVQSIVARVRAKKNRTARTAKT